MEYKIAIEEVYGVVYMIIFNFSHTKKRYNILLKKCHQMSLYTVYIVHRYPIYMIVIWKFNYWNHFIEINGMTSKWNLIYKFILPSAMERLNRVFTVCELCIDLKRRNHETTLYWKRGRKWPLKIPKFKGIILRVIDGRNKG